MNEKKEMLFGFRIHLMITILVSILLISINIISNETLWFYYPVAGMTMGLIIHRGILFYIEKLNTN